MKLILFSLPVILFSLLEASASDWPRWQGKHNQSEWNEGDVVSDPSHFQNSAPNVTWRVPVGLGYSGPSVADGKVFVMDYEKTSGNISNNPSGRNQLKGTERVRCFDLSTGKEIWTHAYDQPYFLSYAAGPRCTPTVSDGKVYALGAEGQLSCLDANTGKVIWEKKLTSEYKTESPIWGYSAHPLVHGDTLYTLAGGEGSVVVALDKDTGAEKWKALSAAEQGYCPPTIIKQAGVEQLIIWHPQSINGLNPANGEVYWSLPLKPSYGMAIMTPRKWKDHLFASGIGRVGALIELGKESPTAKFVWRATPKSALFAANCTPYVLDDHIYGPDITTSSLICARLSDGQRIWTDATPVSGKKEAPRGTRHGTAFLTRNTTNGLFYIFNEQGHLVIADLSPEGYDEKARVPVLEPTNEAFGRPVVWSAPAFADQSMIVRNDKEMVRVDLKK